jgi:hypothetical protein
VIAANMAKLPRQTLPLSKGLPDPQFWGFLNYPKGSYRPPGVPRLW